MTSPITATDGATGAKPVKPTSAAAEIAAAHGTEGVGKVAQGNPIDASVSLSAVPASPPREVLDQMAVAAQRYESLTSQGRELRFCGDGPATTTLELRDRSGALLQRLSLAQAFDLAAGAPLD